MSKRNQNRVPTKPKRQSNPDAVSREENTQSWATSESPPSDSSNPTNTSWILFGIGGVLGFIILVFIGALIADLAGAILFPLLGIGASRLA
jgi:hypothetical protein